jgi:thioredoxin-dependent peroxiredoxin
VPKAIFNAFRGHTRVSFLQGNIVPEEKNPRVGDPAPDFTLPATTGELVSLSDFRGRAEVVLFFYPKDNSPACSAEACSFRDSYETFRDAGAEVIGVSADSPKSHSQFAERLRLPFLLLSDAGGSVRSRYGVSRTFGLVPGRATFLIDKQGIVRHVFSSQFLPLKHASEMLGVLRKLREKT